MVTQPFGVPRDVSPESTWLLHTGGVVKCSAVTWLAVEISLPVRAMLEPQEITVEPWLVEQSPLKIGSRAAFRMPEATLAALVVSMVAEGANGVPLVAVQVSAVPPEVEQSPFRLPAAMLSPPRPISSCPEGSVPAAVTLPLPPPPPPPPPQPGSTWLGMSMVEIPAPLIWT